MAPTNNTKSQAPKKGKEFPVEQRFRCSKPKFELKLRQPRLRLPQILRRAHHPAESSFFNLPGILLDIPEDGSIDTEESEDHFVSYFAGLADDTDRIKTFRDRLGPNLQSLVAKGAAEVLIALEFEKKRDQKPLQFVTPQQLHGEACQTLFPCYEEKRMTLEAPPPKGYDMSPPFSYSPSTGSKW
ncbi:hypothetical protein GLAREA_09061 [Glarea lozoyensis ATCC 20868]|uniref:Uncharacterized protein n=1 Tax=Glarea lozoyensis (strain ATCC 20868 / MF5171) TaxID=1116229 RepID=S3EFD8_GLAL2|nr:uncharacterized protein GLAREA_09061 [Glarea lozoyensis ATCC 20868]EPE36898.1 hypothetical protein GLAREA_09061 [Glarea lozoyensis ATCC 20868]